MEVAYKIKAISSKSKATNSNSKVINNNSSNHHNSRIQTCTSIAGLMEVVIIGDLNVGDQPMVISRELLSKTRWEGV
eukprot:7766359-Ditylum_brightwellii.AAC.1